MTDPTTTIAGTKYSTKLLGGREARTVGVLVTSAVLRGLGAAMAKADLSKILAKAPALADGEPSQLLASLVATTDWKELASVLGGLADGGATLLEMLGPDGLEILTAHFTAQTTAFLPPDHPGAAGVYPVPLASREDHWQGKWPQFLQWLAWCVRANGFLGDWDALVARSKQATGTAGAPQEAPHPAPT